jgi:hypothetical protein
MSVSDHIATASDKAFAGRVMLLMLKVAQTITTESPGANHKKRLRYAASVIYGNEKPQLMAAHVIAATAAIASTINTNPSELGSNVTDADLEAAISGLWTVRSIAFHTMQPPLPEQPAPADA